MQVVLTLLFGMFRSSSCSDSINAENSCFFFRIITVIRENLNLLITERIEIGTTNQSMM